MKSFFALVLVFLFVFGAISAVSATEIVFVSPDGSDFNDGSLLAPFATLQAAVDAVSKGGTVYMREGTYTAGAELSKSVTIKAYNDEKVVFSASQKGILTPISADERSIFEDDDVWKKVYYIKGIERIGMVCDDGASHALLFDEEYMRPASLFNNKYVAIDFERMDKQSDGTYEYIGKMNVDAQLMSKYKKGYITGVLDGRDFVTEYQLNIDSDQYNISIKPSIYLPELPNPSDLYTAKIWFEYDASFIDELGDWGVKNDKVYVYPGKTEKEIEYLSDYETYITAKNLNDIKISGIEFSKTLGNAVNLKNCDNAIVSGCVFKNITDTAVVMEECENAKIFNCKFEHNAARCIGFENTNNSLIDNCRFEDNAALCRVGNPYIDISGDFNRILRSELLTSPCGAIEICGKSNAVTGCFIKNASYYDYNVAIAVGDSAIDTEITENYISGNEKDFIYLNKFNIITKPMFAIGISRKSSSTLISKNIIEDCSNAIDIGASSNNKINNNVFYTEKIYISLESYTDPITKEETVPKNNNISNNVLCEQEDIRVNSYKSEGNVFENNIKFMLVNALERDGRIKLGNIREKLPEFENINFDEIGRYEATEEEPVAYEGEKYDNIIKVLLNGEKIDFADVAPQIINDRTMVPLRAIFEALGAEVAWDDATKTVTAIKGDVTIKMTIGADSFKKNDESVALDSPATIVDSRTLVPVRAIAESFGSKVGWIAESKTVTIED